VEHVIDLQGLGKRYGHVPALRSVDLQVERGSVTALLGMNGAGKTTLIRCLMGLITPDAGRGRVMGYDLGPGYPPVELKARVGYVADRPALYGNMTAAELLAFVRGVHRRWDATTVQRYLDLFGLPLGRKVATYSTGMRSQLALTLAMGGSPDLLILDEPTVGLDPYHRNQYLQLLLSDAVAAGRTVFLSTHDLHQIERLADHVVILHQGQVAVAAPLDQLKEETKRVRVAFAGTAAPGPAAAGAPADTPVGGYRAPDAGLRATLAALPGVRTVQQEGRNWLLTVQGQVEVTLERLRAFPGCTGLQVFDMSLEEIFLAFVQPDGA
jgi:ABC-2 type transport system ATP-binding protein